MPVGTERRNSFVDYIFTNNRAWRFPARSYTGQVLYLLTIMVAFDSRLRFIADILPQYFPQDNITASPVSTPLKLPFPEATKCVVHTRHLPVHQV